MKKPLAVLLISGLMACPIIASAQSFRYIDESGNIYWADSINDIPARYRTQILGEPTIDPEMLDKRGNIKKNYRPKEVKPTKAPKPTRVPRQPNIPRSRFQKDPAAPAAQRQLPAGYNPYGAPQPGVQMPPAFPPPGLPGVIEQQQVYPNQQYPNQQGYPVDAMQPAQQQIPVQQAPAAPHLPAGMGGELAPHQESEVEAGQE